MNIQLDSMTIQLEYKTISFDQISKRFFYNFRKKKKRMLAYCIAILIHSFK